MNLEALYNFTGTDADSFDTDLGKAMVGISDVKGDHVNFRDREGGHKEATGEGIPKKRKLHGHTETQLYGSSWE